MTCCPNWLFKWRSSARSLPGLPYDEEREEDSWGESIDSSPSLSGMLMGLVGESWEFSIQHIGRGAWYQKVNPPGPILIANPSLHNLLRMSSVLIDWWVNNRRPIIRLQKYDACKVNLEKCLQKMLPNMHDVVCSVVWMFCYIWQLCFSKTHMVLGSIGQYRFSSVLHTWYLARFPPCHYHKP